MKENVLSILSDYYKSCDHLAVTRIAVLELIEQVSLYYVLQHYSPTPSLKTSALPPDDIVQYKTEAILCDQFDIKVTRVKDC